MFRYLLILIFCYLIYRIFKSIARYRKFIHRGRINRNQTNKSGRFKKKDYEDADFEVIDDENDKD